MNNIQKKTYIDKDETDSMEKKQMKKNKLCAHTITRQDKQGLQAVYNIINDNFVTNYGDKNE